MRLGIFAVYDVKSDVYAAPFFMPAKGMAIRAFTDLANNLDTYVGRHPNDYKLVYLGEFDDNSGDFFPSGGESLGFAVEYKHKPDIVALAEVKNVSA